MSKLLISLNIAFLLTFLGCTSTDTNPYARGAAIGAASGAAVGAGTGAIVGETAAGAGIGAGAGAAAGAGYVHYKRNATLEELNEVIVANDRRIRQNERDLDAMRLELKNDQREIRVNPVYEAEIYTGPTLGNGYR